MRNGITENEINEFFIYLRHEEKSINTAQKYTHDVHQFAVWLQDREITKEAVTEWKEHLCTIGKATITVNSALAALHSFFTFRGITNCRVKYLKRQQRLFRDSSRDLDKSDYEKLVSTAEQTGSQRLALLLETICATGIRVSEVKYITVESVQKGQTNISMKGKVRTILIPNKLAKKLVKYAKKQKIASGEIFRTRSGNSLSRRQIWGEMKKICKAARVDESKVFPHNLRHLFARSFFKASHDIVKLANILGHSSIETTRIYLIATYEEHTRELDRLGLVS